jgi:hypothetical protein
MSFQNLIPGTIVPANLVRGVGGTVVAQASHRVAANQDIREGDVLVRSAGGDTVEQALTLPVAGATTPQLGALVIVGVALQNIKTNASGVDIEQANANSIQVARWSPNNEFAFPLIAATAGAAEPRDVSAGAAYEICRVNTTLYGSGYGWNLAGTTNPVAKLFEQYDNNDNTSQYTLYWGTPQF